jgi:hypothetical protein
MEGVLEFRVVIKRGSVKKKEIIRLTRAEVWPHAWKTFLKLLFLCLSPIILLWRDVWNTGEQCHDRVERSRTAS